MSSSALLNALRSRRPAFGAWLTLPGIFNARIVAQASPYLSWVCVDCEHGLTSLHPGVAESIQSILSVRHQTNPQNTRSSPPSPLVRIPAMGSSHGGSAGWQIKYALDAGAHGVVVPMVNTPERAREIVQDCRFPPLGRRGFGSPFTHSVWGLESPREYVNLANKDLLVLAQIESEEAVHNVEEIAATDGIDILFVGPFDLSLSLGFDLPSQELHPEVEKSVMRIKKAAHSAGKYVAIYCTSGEKAAERAAQGFDMVNVVSDCGALTQSVSRNLAEAIRGTT